MSGVCCSWPELLFSDKLGILSKDSYRNIWTRITARHLRTIPLCEFGGLESKWNKVWRILATVLQGCFSGGSVRNLREQLEQHVSSERTL